MSLTKSARNLLAMMLESGSNMDFVAENALTIEVVEVADSKTRLGEMAQFEIAFEVGKYVAEGVGSSVAARQVIEDDRKRAEQRRETIAKGRTQRAIEQIYERHQDLYSRLQE